MSTIKANTLLHSDGSTTNPPAIPALDTRMAKAWINFNGQTGGGIRDSHNVSSITDNSTGNFTINLATNTANANYAVATSGMQVNSTTFNAEGGQVYAFSYTTSSFTVGCKQDYNGGVRDFFYTSAIMIGG